ncbi:MAG: nicotinate-nucleotide--dimethylbenzimidazole phosphoribosyltransferase, partial [Thermoleophilia bacterium]
GAGAGGGPEHVARKTELVRRAVALHRPGPDDPLGALAAVGGLEHAALAGLILGGARARRPVILDGVSTVAAALVAVALAPAAGGYLIAAHRSTEPGASVALEALRLRPLLELEMRLGEGTGALLALPLVRAAAAALSGMAALDEVAGAR